MIDPETANARMVALATAIGELMEDGAGEALQRPDGGADGYHALACRLRTAGEDIAVLVTALEVLARQSE